MQNNDLQCNVTKSMDLIKITIYKYININTIAILVPEIVDNVITYTWLEKDAYENISECTFALSRVMLVMGIGNMLIDGLIKAIGYTPTDLKDHLDKFNVQNDHLETLKKLIFDSSYVNIERGEKEREVIE